MGSGVINIEFLFFAEKGGGRRSGDAQNEHSPKSNSKPSKEKSSKAERRALQEAQRAAKAASKGAYFYLIKG